MKKATAPVKVLGIALPRLYEDRLPDLQPYLDFYNKGLEKAHETRDALSTKRMTSATRRRASWSSFF